MKVTVIGSGSWGTALAQVLADNLHDVTIWGKDLDEVVDIHMYHQNEKYFPGVHINEDVKATNDLSLVADAEMVILAVPTAAIEDVCLLINQHFTRKVLVVSVAKGFHPVTHKRLSVVIRETVKPEILDDVVSLIGPSHAEEVVLRLLTTINAVCENEESSIRVQQAFSNNYFRVYRNTDVIGAETGVAIKNIIAIASGILSGLGLGDNARAALMTRGLAEMSRYGIYFGAKPETYLGLTGVGDLIVTCTSVHSRNFQAGLMIGKSDSAKSFWENNTKTVEGVKAAKVIFEEAHKLDISMPITEQVYKVLYENAIPSQSILELMKRELKAE
ncbi:MAG TPA: NAD(P)H-dependent glycerol-3-phosphate dehydrogenase [Erysipelotrichaceae bacterium]|nr:MAG: glycerol-3-phosphate dehydrogenase [Firmicutes bacterium GWE2_51_13]HBZ41192.1 NAD(P)H-dependent glycerol-3-phosphate dehydrogenase [Erysipelotrichaceae bacterium]